MNEQELAASPETMDEVADEFLKRYRQGKRPSITEYVHAHPGLAAEIRELFPTLIVLEQLGPRQEEIAGQQNGTAASGPTPLSLGEYRILREVGRGGMGIVYEAEQTPLGRHVALKVLPASAVLNPSILTRFQNEVRAVARLHHTNIVPVFGVGEDQGTHYYAMQFIAGQGLDVVLEELRRLRSSEPIAAAAATEDPSLLGRAAGISAPSARGNPTSHGTSPAEYFRSVARMGVQVAEALAHAHSQGVLHRDIKPSNLLLDAQGCVWVTDFGLAKQEGCDVTNTGDVVGTLRYLAPERFQGRSDARTDIYGLGVTLYELLTTQPAFAMTDRARLVHEIVHSDPPSPRRCEHRLPRDLETIVLKAIAKDPAERYASASDMAADLRHFLDDKPIGARPLSLGERLRRWCVRRPALASLAVALLLSLAVGMGSVGWQWARAETNLKEAVRQKNIAGQQQAIAQRQATRAEDNFQTARKSVNELLTLVSEDDLMNQPGLQPVRLKLLTKALEFHEQMLADRDQDPAVRRDLALGYLRVAMLKRQMGTVNGALEAYRRAIELLETASAPGKSDRETVVLLVRAYSALAVEHISQRDMAPARALLDQARTRIDEVLSEAPDDVGGQQASAMTFNNQAYLISESPELDRATRKEASLRLHEQALAIYRSLAARQPPEPALQMSIATTLSNMARRQISLGRMDDARRLLEECLEIRLELSRPRPESLTMKHYVAAAHNGLGDVVLWSQDRTPESVARAAADYERAVAIQTRLTQESPAVLFYWQEFAGTLENMGRLYRESGDAQRALDWRRREIEALKTCLNLQPESIELRARWATQLDGQATMEGELRLHAQSLASRLQAREAWRPIQMQPPVALRYRAPLRLHMARLMVELGMQDRPTELYQVACERRELSDGSPNALFADASALQKATRAATRSVAQSEESRAATAKCQQLAVDLFREAALAAPEKVADLARGQAHMRIFAGLVQLDADLARTPINPSLLARRSRILRRLGDSSGAGADEDRAVQLLDSTLQASPNNRGALRERANLHLDAGRWQLAAADSSRVLAQRPDDVVMLECRARASMRLARWQQAHDDYSRALKLRPDLIGHWPHHCRGALELGQEDEARASAARLVELAGDDVFRVEALIWAFLVERQVARFPEASIALGKRESELATQHTHRRPLGGVYVQLGRYLDAIEALAPDNIDMAGESPAFAAFWLAISHHHLGEREKAEQAFHQGVRNWKGAGALTAGREDFLRSTWQEARTLLFGSETPAARS